MTGDRGVTLEALPPAEEVEGYRDLSVIGNGTTSRVYRAYQDRVRRWVALKVLQADGQGDAVRQRFDRERSLLAELGAHPHIVQVLDAGRTAAGRPYVAMELCDGSMADRIERDGPLDWPEALDIMIKIAGATQAAHDLGVLHQDIKPPNILVSKYGPMLADFGIARAKAGLGATTGTLQMSPLYAAPEVFFGAAAPSEASDVYSLGASLYALLTGQTPFAGVSDDHVYDYLTRIQVEHPAAFGRTDLPSRLLAVVARSISADPARRHPDAERFADELHACLHGRPPVAAVPSGPPVADPSPPPAPAAVEPRLPGTPTKMPSPEPGELHVRDATVRRPARERAATWPPRPSTSGEPWRPAPAPPRWRHLAPAGLVALLVVGLLAVAATMMVVGPERTSATKDPSPEPTTAPPIDRATPATPTTAAPTTAPAPTGPAAPSEQHGAAPAGDPFPTLTGFGFRVPSDAGRYRSVESGHRRALTEALGVEVPEAQTREIVADGKVVGFAFAHPLPAVDAAIGERWATVGLPGSVPGSVTATGPTDVRVAANGKNWVASWWEAPNGFVTVFGNEALLRSFLAEWGDA